MSQKLNMEIAEVKEKLRRKEKLQNLLKRTREDLKEQKLKKEELYEILKSEEKDVEKLQSLSITGLFHSILGNKEQQLEKERQEYLGAKLKYDECLSSITTLEKEIISYNEELSEYLGIEFKYDDLIKEKERLILGANDQRAERLVNLTEKLSDVKGEIKETKEAISAGERVRIALEKAKGALESARGWGQWDMIGGGFLATAAKHSKIDEAKGYVYEVQSLLGAFKRELSDLHLYSNVNVNIGSFEKFADYFFDGLISDWIVQSKINNSLNNVYSTYDNVRSILTTLTGNLNKLESQIKSLEREMEEIIESEQ